MSNNPFLKPKKPNPFLTVKKEPDPPPTKLKKTDADNLFLKPPPGKRKTKKPVGPARLSEQDWELLRAKSRALLAAKGISVGDKVRVWWKYDSSYEEERRAQHDGVVEILDDCWLEVTSSTCGNGFLRLPLTAVAAIERVEKLKDTKPKRKNPFL